jgi:phosphoribosylformylglycinamidine synthase subunit PurQ / glutaminase
MAEPRVLVLRAAGTNCDQETAEAFRRAGGRPDMLHVFRLFEAPERLHDYRILAIPGGFTYGDDVAAGAVLAAEMRARLLPDLKRFVEGGGLVLGICNGFQVLVKAGLLPALGGLGERGDLTLTWNDSGRYEDRWVRLRVDTDLTPFFTKGDVIDCPVAHAEGKIVVSDPSVVERLRAAGQVVVTYLGPQGEEAEYPWNPNGSEAGIAGVCDPTGRVLGLMPHPERNIDPTHHPRWTREGETGGGVGLRVFTNAVEHVT